MTNEKVQDESLQLWTFQDDKLINKHLNENWLYGDRSWMLENGLLIEKKTMKVLDIGDNMENSAYVSGTRVGPFMKHSGSNQQWEVIMARNNLKNYDQRNFIRWMKIRNPRSGLFLTASEKGSELTVQHEVKTGKSKLFMRSLFFVVQSS